MSPLYAILGLFASVGAVAGIYAIWKGGRASVQRDQAERTVEAGKTRVQVDEDLRWLPDDDLRQRLRKPPS